MGTDYDRAAGKDTAATTLSAERRLAAVVHQQRKSIPRTTSVDGS